MSFDRTRKPRARAAREHSIGRLFQKLENENEVQRWVAYELWHRQHRAYSCEREPHVADEKESDIRLQARAAQASLKGWSNVRGELLSFAQVLAHLQVLADRIAGKDSDSPQVQVCAIDVSDL
jgi:hypothetical protein